ncbi:MAG TPA: AI-2E family transporter [Pseudonocardiaceae bacterium]|mgnify:CR=1 FL=1
MTDSRLTQRRNAADEVPFSLRVAAAVGWRFLVVAGALYVLGYVFSHLGVVLVPVAIALLLAALLAPAVDRLSRWGVPRGLATAVVLVGGLGLVGGVLTFVINAFTDGLPDMQRQVAASLNTIRDWLKSGPLHLREEQLDEYTQRLVQAIQENQAAITSSALTTAATLGQLLTGLLLALFTLIFLLYDGRRIWLFLVGMLPRHVQSRVDLAGSRAFTSLTRYVQATALVAAVDAIGIGIGLWIIGVPLAVPLSALVFLGGFVPIVGALVSGAVAVLVALVANGLVPALLVLGVVLLVQQLEGHVLQPLLMGRAVKLHPLAVVLAIAIGVHLAGIAGALLSVPLVAVTNSAIRSLVDKEGATAVPESVVATARTRPLSGGTGTDTPGEELVGDGATVADTPESRTEPER